ncbi:uncharacterized protein L969DRAFT_48951 [Mixia osmundae IAM 14324]|uniref:histidinol-phosphate transaminase n=1 Tax=Mixia osmundae (strain CBS 9802 / IAM 14324 / JCM 22182 / KY 12970) TaxID=764103 RepID=G7DVK7_MIXOS|nr:uncharacterized protein L969DRAFT_48951 [Mixia osmundae IAM 14324]KEI39540.1 hypothetical protein L969DRAFT_48951 [Mixia osmundae IAM 14324]GAA94617.1 hypothetical protein E5Q_01269 [Mixia osmundae IAM 14324]
MVTSNGTRAKPYEAKPKGFDLRAIIRPNILELQPYRCARDDYSSGVLLDANENSLGSALPRPSGSYAPLDADSSDGMGNLHRYPDPQQNEIKARIAKLRGLRDEIGAAGIFLGVGSDEVIDMLMRVTCYPGKDSILITPPTYGMYSVCAKVNDVALVKVPLDDTFVPRLDEINAALTPAVKLVFLTSPGNPTGTLIPLQAVRQLLDHPTWHGLVVLDEAYIDFAEPEASGVTLLNEGYQNLVVMQTLSKGFGLAGIRLGCCISSRDFAQILFNTKAPYNISTPTAQLALQALEPAAIELTQRNLAQLIKARSQLITELIQLDGIGKVRGANHANFILIEILNATSRKPDNARAVLVYKTLAEDKGVVVRFRGTEPGCEGCVRITVGSPSECKTLLREMKLVLATS